MSALTKKPRVASKLVIGTHSGTFQADEALGVYLLRVLPLYHKSPVVRSRDLKVLEPLDIVIDVGGVYDHSKLRYDHHQRGFAETLSEVGYTTKLSATGLVYRHYGREIITTLHPTLPPAILPWVYSRMYGSFVEAVDGIDNGVEIVPEGSTPMYRDGSGLSARVGRLNKRWNEEGGGTEDERFEVASKMAGEEFESVLRGIVESEVPARVLVEEAVKARFDVHEGGEIIKFPSGGMPWKGHLYEIEEDLKLDGVIKFVLYTDQAGMWRVQAVTVKGTAFTNRVGLLEEWRGVRDEELSGKSGIEGCTFVHNSGFIGGNKTFEGALKMAIKTLEGSK